MNQTLRKAGVRYYNLAYVVVHQTIMDELRYPVNMVAGVVSVVVLFAVIFFGGQAIGFEAVAESTAGLIIGYYLFLLATQAYQGTSNMITKEAGWGTLEHHFASPFGFDRVMIMKGTAKILWTFALNTVVLVVLMIITNEFFVVPIFTVIFILLFTLIAVFGVGLAVGGLAVLYKRIENLTALFNFVIIGLVGAPVLEAPWLRAFPIVQGSIMLQETIREGTQLWEFAPTEISILMVIGLGYFIPAILAFRLFHRRARKLGVLGDY